MAEVKKSPAKHAWILVFQAPVVIVGIGAIAAAATDLIDMRTGLTVFGAAFAVSMAVSVGLMRSYRCPECGQRLLPPKAWWRRFPGVPILMSCERCDVDWDVGLRGPQA